ncbi:MAG: hypothetical protein NTU76_02885 [Candidatus Taylorbacteria bacterium]|nr:hypothetical protein [Candidatus Taylorbacteria bacterium]
MSHLIKEKIKQVCLVVFFVLVAFLAVLIVLSVLSDNGQGSVSIKDELNRKTIKDTELMVSVHANSKVSMSMNNGPVTGKLDLSGISFDIKNAK